MIIHTPLDQIPKSSINSKQKRLEREIPVGSELHGNHQVTLKKQQLAAGKLSVLAGAARRGAVAGQGPPH